MKALKTSGRPARKPAKAASRRVRSASSAKKPATPIYQSLQQIVMAARRNLSQELWDHLSGGSDSETTLRRNRQALDSLALRQRVLSLLDKRGLLS